MSSCSQRLHDVLLPLCVRLQQQQLSSNVSCDSTAGISGQYSSALTRRELYRYQRTGQILSSLASFHPFKYARFFKLFGYLRIGINMF